MTEYGKYLPRYIFCGGVLCWDNCEMAEDVSDSYKDDEEATLYYYTCSKCGRMYEIIDPTQEEKECDFSDFWKGKQSIIQNDMNQEYFKELLERIDSTIKSLENAKTAISEAEKKRLELFSKYPSITEGIKNNKKL